MYWKCSCGEKMNENGDNKGLSAFQKHWWASQKGEIEGEHTCIGLFDNNGELLVKGRSIIQAQKKGYLQKSNKNKSKNNKKEIDEDNDLNFATRTVKVKTQITEIILHNSIFFIYYITRAKFPEYNPTIGDWICEVVIEHYTEHPELGMDSIMQLIDEFRNREVEQYE